MADAEAHFGMAGPATHNSPPWRGAMGDENHDKLMPI